MKMNVLSVALACLVAGSSCAAENSAKMAGDTSSKLSERYHLAKDQYERRLVCIEAIDKGLIACGRNVQILKEIFGHPPYFEKLRSGESSAAVVFFNIEQIKQDSKPAAAAALSGWYLYCKYNSKMQIVSYHVTNSPFTGSAW
jgi:hypothetical protein